MNSKIIAVIIIIFMVAGYACASEPETAPEKKKPPAKPRPDSAISIVLQLPIVQKWQKWMTLKKNDSSFIIKGEEIKEVQGSKCWDVAVGESSDDGDHIWHRFCVSQTGIEVWVESIPAEPTEEIHYLPYDDWMSKCKPTYNSPGKC